MKFELNRIFKFGFLCSCCIFSLSLLFSCGKSNKPFGTTNNPGLGNTDSTSHRDSSNNGSSKKPNIIVIIAESQRAETLEGSENSFVQTPNLDKLANQGVKFTNFFVTTAICTVSRSNILTGQYEQTIGNEVFSKGFSPSAFAGTYPMVLKRAGYYVGWMGLFGPPNPPKNLFDFYVDEPWVKNGVHNTDLIVNDMKSFLSNYKKDAPFFVCMNFDAAHEIDPKGFNPPDHWDSPAHYLIQSRFANLYSNIEIREPETASAAFWNCCMPSFLKNPKDIARKRWYGFFSTKALFEKNTKDYYRLITGLDDAVGRIRNTLKKNGFRKNTVIIYTSDHGVSLGEHGLMGKWYPYDVSMHVPFILYDPRDTSLAGKKINAFGLNIDIAPTVLKLAGLQPLKSMEGKNLLKIADGKITPRKSFLYEFGIYGAPRLFKSKAIITKQYRYIKYTENGYEQLFDIVNDPEEAENLVDNTKYKSVLKKMRNLLQQKLGNLSQDQ
jgi:arylsulfatase A-like enzyme